MPLACHNRGRAFAPTLGSLAENGEVKLNRGLQAPDTLGAPIR